MVSAGKQSQPVQAKGTPEQAAEHLIAVIDELIVVVVEENASLARGLPSALSALTKRKNELADELERWASDVASRKLDIRSCSDVLRQTYVGRVKVLRVVMDENVDRLRTAIDASRRRIDAVMQAIRREVGTASMYNADGRARETRNSQSVYGVVVSV
jgi:flagellar biosynthesis/type III secretory pathway chaperone